jgi:phosphatidylserine decarboxylase
MRWLPRRGLSRTVGWLARRRAPRFVLDPILRWYSGHYGVNELEMKAPLESYATFVEFFTRPLRDGVRPHDPDPLAITSCADGRVQRAGRIEAGTLLQVKGLTYTVEALLGDAPDAVPFHEGACHVAYLSPGDYHRYHWPWSGRVEKVRHIPGELWPVNETAVHSVRSLFAENERVVVLGTTDTGHRFAYIPVGALNVGSIRLSFHDVTTNHARADAPETWDVDVAFARGDECGWFELGSTIVLLLEASAGTFDPLQPGRALKVGERIGALSPADGS